MVVNQLGQGVESGNNVGANISIIEGALDIAKKDIRKLLDTGFPSSDDMAGDIQQNTDTYDYTKVGCPQTSVYCKPTSSFPKSCAC